MATIEEKRVYTEGSGRSELYVAGAVGVVVVNVSDDLVGEFSLVHDDSATDVAAGAGHVAVASVDDVLVLEGGSFEPLGFGPAVAVDIETSIPDPSEGTESDTGITVIAADESGRIAHRHRPESEPDERGDSDGTAQWVEVGTVPGTVTAIDWPFVATSEGLYRTDGAGLEHVGLTAVTDVAATGIPLAATETGLYRLGNGWMSLREGSFHVVASDGSRAHAAGEGGLYDGSADWEPVSLPVSELISDLAYTPAATVGVTEAGTVLLSAGDGWRTRAIGVAGVEGVAVR